eukprot:m51a1_g1577 hypothetical protein (817) ;mRNA; r:96781-100057
MADEPPPPKAPAPSLAQRLAGAKGSNFAALVSMAAAHRDSPEGAPPAAAAAAAPAVASPSSLAPPQPASPGLPPSHRSHLSSTKSARSSSRTKGGVIPSGPPIKTDTEIIAAMAAGAAPRPAAAAMMASTRLRMAARRVQPAIRMKHLQMDKITVGTPRNKKDNLPKIDSALDGLAPDGFGLVGTALGLDVTMSSTQEEALEMQQSAAATVDPFLRNRPKLRVGGSMYHHAPVILGVTFGLLLACYGLDNGMTRVWSYKGMVPAKYDYSFNALVYTIMNPNPDQCRSVLEGVTNIMSVVFAVLVTLIGLVLQFASEKVTSHCLTLFFKDKFITGGLSAVIITQAFSFWIYLECGDHHSTRIGMVVCVALVNIELMFLFPFLTYLFFFLDPEVVVTKIMTNGLNAVVAAINSQGVDNAKHQIRATLAVEYLMDGALSSIKKKNKNIASEILDALCSFLMHYISIKDSAPDVWYDIPLWLKQSPDFLIVNAEELKVLEKRQLWMEWKVLRQYHNIFVEAIKFFKEMCYHICINTRIIGETAALHQQMHTVDLCIKFFNTYLRTAINLIDVRVVYNTLFQYRQFAELLLDKDRGSTKELATRALQIAKFVRYYAFLCQQRNLSFLVETVAQDLRVMCEVAIRSSLPERTKTGKVGWNPARVVFQQTLLSFTDFASTPDARRGVLRAQVILAVYYLTLNQTAQARKIYKAMDREENKEILLSIREELSMGTTKEFWEVSERGSNFTYLEPHLVEQLGNFFGNFAWFTDHHSEEVWKTFINSAAGKNLRVQQELQKFDEDIQQEPEADDSDDDMAPPEYET